MHDDLPDVEYRTALDIYVYGCYTFLLVSAVEFAIVHRYTKGPVFEEHDMEVLRRRLYDAEMKQDLEDVTKIEIKILFSFF